MRSRTVAWLCGLGALVLLAPRPSSAQPLFRFCGVYDNDALDSDTTTGTIQTPCSFQNTGSFVGSASVFSSASSFGITVTGSFAGSGQLTDFVSGSYDVTGGGFLYLFPGMALLGVPGALTTGADFLTFSGQTAGVRATTNLRPLYVGQPLPVRWGPAGSGLEPAQFAGPSSLSGDVSFFASAGDTFDGSLTYLVETCSPSTNPCIVPEPSSAVLCAIGVAGILLGSRWRKRLVA